MAAASIWFEVWGSWDVWGVVGSGHRNFRFHPNKLFSIFYKNFDFSRQKITMTFISQQLEKVSFSPQIFNFYRLHLYSCLIVSFLFKKPLSNILSVQNRSSETHPRAPGDPQ